MRPAPPDTPPSHTPGSRRRGGGSGRNSTHQGRWLGRCSCTGAPSALQAQIATVWELQQPKHSGNRRRVIAKFVGGASGPRRQPQLQHRLLPWSCGHCTRGGTAAGAARDRRFQTMPGSPRRALWAAHGQSTVCSQVQPLGGKRPHLNALTGDVSCVGLWWEQG